MDINPNDKVSYTTQYREGFPKYVENESYAKHRRQLLNQPERVASNNPFSTTASGSSQCCFDADDLSRDDDKYLTAKNVPEMTPGCSACAACFLNAARLYLNSPHDPPKN